MQLSNLIDEGQSAAIPLGLSTDTHLFVMVAIARVTARMRTSLPKNTSGRTAPPVLPPMVAC